MEKKVIDLFAGVGGLSLGAARAGFDVAAAVELDKRAYHTHSVNFPGAAHLHRDISNVTGKELRHLAGIEKNDFFGIVGGPPCQGFSEIGLRNQLDPRNDLLGQFFRLVADCRPAFFLAENVPGVLLPRYAETLESALAKVPQNYTILPPIKISANAYGAPTSRTRVFFMGFDHSRINPLKESDFHAKSSRDVRVAEALSGLPAIRSDWQSEKQSWRKVSFADAGDYLLQLSRHVPKGVGDPVALEAYRTAKLVSGFLGTAHTPDTVKRFKKLRPGQRDEVSRAVRLDLEGYCPTLRAGTGPERGSFQAVRPIHPTSPRVISPREAARLQGFPDWFQFDATKWHAFRQIGNSVSPIVAEHLLKVVARAAA